ncbi:unnamed protein product [Triticum turgidum subsp. durum]|uniref:Uncharacterized protein n=1 Tax=Triticum turgidum subsp. durum TaxID=4567 RepID=A0A9R1NHA8_TRITD|nr:unnamed protein product [Triticum turgidum subsp. durum]
MQQVHAHLRPLTLLYIFTQARVHVVWKTFYAALLHVRLHPTTYMLWQPHAERVSSLSFSLVAVGAAMTIHLIDDCITYTPVGNEPRFMTHE